MSMPRDEALEHVRRIGLGQEPSGSVVIAVTGPNSLSTTTSAPYADRVESIEVVDADGTLDGYCLVDRQVVATSVRHQLPATDGRLLTPVRATRSEAWGDAWALSHAGRRSTELVYRPETVQAR